MARIDYVELPSATAHELTRAFYARAFGWAFTDYGPDYSATTTGDIDVGLNGQPDEALATPLPVIRVDDLEAAFASVTKAGGTIAKPETIKRELRKELEIERHILETLTANNANSRQLIYRMADSYGRRSSFAF